MIDLYLRFPIPEEDKLLSFSGKVAVDNRNRVRIPSVIRNVFSHDIFDILVFDDKNIPYVQLFPKDFFSLSYISFLKKWQSDNVDQSYITNGMQAFDAYKSRANTLTVDSNSRILLPPTALNALSLQSTKEIYMVMSYPWIKLYRLGDYNKLLKSYENSSQ